MSSTPNNNNNTTSQPDGDTTSNDPFSTYAATLGLFMPRHPMQHLRPDYRQVPPPLPPFTPTIVANKPTIAPKQPSLEEMIRKIMEQERKPAPSLANRMKKYCDNKKYGCERPWSHKTEECEMSSAEKEKKKAEMKAQRASERKEVKDKEEDKK